MKKCIVCLLTLVMLVSMTACTPPWDVPVAEKPVIYLYPEEETGVMVELDYNGTLLCTYPEYADGWSVIASPDGTLRDTVTGKEYSYLFWEGVADIKWDMTRGYVVKGSETANFLALRKILCKKKSNQTLPVKRADREILLLIALFPEWERGMRASA